MPNNTPGRLQLGFTLSKHISSSIRGHFGCAGLLAKTFGN
jgi:hypothetical protein